MKKELNNLIKTLNEIKEKVKFIDEFSLSNYYNFENKDRELFLFTLNEMYGKFSDIYSIILDLIMKEENKTNNSIRKEHID